MTVQVVVPAPWVTSRISVSIRIKNSPEGGNEDALLTVKELAVVDEIAPFKVEEPS
jgi:hypothetical protein